MGTGSTYSALEDAWVPKLLIPSAWAKKELTRPEHSDQEAPPVGHVLQGRHGDAADADV